MPISSIPEDILLEIFFLCSEYDWEGNAPILFPVLDWDWINITHVSRYWRSLAVSSPLLWRKPLLAWHSRGRLEAFLERSQGSPLIISTYYLCGGFGNFNNNNKGCKSCKKNVITSLQHLHHIRLLKINNGDPDVIGSMFNRPAPLLEVLSISTSSSQYSEEQEIHFPDGLLISSTPSLKEVVLDGLNVPYNSLRFRGLEWLELDNSSFRKNRDVLRAPFNPTLQDLLETLQLSSSLKRLCLLTVRYTEETGEYLKNRTLHRIELPDVLEFNIREVDIHMCDCLLYNIELPDYTEMSIGLQYFNSSELPAIAGILAYTSAYKQCNVLYLGLSDSRTYGNAETTIEFGSKENVLSGRSRLSLTQIDEFGNQLNDEETDYGEIAGMMMNLIRASYWKDASRLEIRVSTHYILDTNQWRMLFETFKCVAHLNVIVFDIPIVNPDGSTPDEELLQNNIVLLIVIISALTLQSQPEAFIEQVPVLVTSEQPRRSVILPHLTSLSFEVFSLSIIADQILHCAKIRDECGSRIKDLRISSLGRSSYRVPPPSKEWLEQIGRYVDDVHCY